MFIVAEIKLAIRWHLRIALHVCYSLARGESDVQAMGAVDTNDGLRTKKGVRINFVSDPSPKHLLTPSQPNELSIKHQPISAQSVLILIAC
jgi:hypothetical protein